MLNLNYFDFIFIYFLVVNFLLLLASFGGLFATRRNLIIIFISIEMILLSAVLNFSYLSVFLDDLFGVLFSIVILGLAAAESSIGLALLVANYRHKAIVSVDMFSVLKS
jgi:NADH-quinone oxidoreductase subunit K